MPDGACQGGFVATRPVTVVGGGSAPGARPPGSSRAGASASRFTRCAPSQPTAVHRTASLAELVCSNSLKSLELSTAHGLLKEEMERLGSLIVSMRASVRGCPPAVRWPSTASAFSEAVTRHARARAEHRRSCARRCAQIPDGHRDRWRSGRWSRNAARRRSRRFTGRDYLYFFDAIAPVIEADTHRPHRRLRRVALRQRRWG